jgi:hypothetical protein
VARDPGARQELMDLGVMSVPLLIIGERRIMGFNPPEIDAALAALPG